MISVIIPTCNGARYIAEAIESVLEQSLPPGEILVVDDGSSDGTAEIVRRCPSPLRSPVRYVPQDHRGPGAARNRGIRESNGEFLAFLDADDLWAPEKLALQSAALAEDPQLDLVFSSTIQFRSPELDASQAAKLVCDGTPQPSTLISCLLARRSAFDRVGPLREDLKAEFLDWYLRAQEARLKIRILDPVLVRRRIHPANFSLTNRDVRREYLHLLKLSLNRRRAASNQALGAAKPST